ncbi:hypothetical protein WDU94_010208 [Cyamophila willieti]
MILNVVSSLALLAAIFSGSGTAFVSSESGKVPILNVTTNSNAPADSNVTSNVIGVFLQVQEVLLRLVGMLQGVVTHLMSTLIGEGSTSTPNRRNNDQTLDIINKTASDTNSLTLERRVVNWSAAPMSNTTAKHPPMINNGARKTEENEGVGDFIPEKRRNK